MVVRKKCPLVYWSQTDNEVNLYVDLLLDDMKPNIKLDDKFLSLEAYGFGTADYGPHEYYFEIDLFESINIEASVDNISNAGKQLQFILQKQNPNIWWSRLTAQPQKQNWIHIHEKTWISRNEISPDEHEYRDIRVDYPGIENVVHQEELGYKKTDMKTVYLIMYNLYQFIAYFYIVLVLSITLSRDGFTREISKTTYKTVGPAMKCNQILQYLEFLNALVGYTKGSPLFPFLQVTGRNFVLFAIIHVESRIQEMPVVFVLFMVWSLVELIRYPYYIISLVKKEVPLLTWLRYTVWIVLYPLGFLCEGTVLLRSLPFFEETKRFTVEMPNKWNFTFDMVAFMKIYMGFILLPGLYIVMKHMTKLRTKKLKKPIIHRTKRTRYD